MRPFSVVLSTVDSYYSIIHIRRSVIGTNLFAKKEMINVWKWCMNENDTQVNTTNKDACLSPSQIFLVHIQPLERDHLL